MTDVQDAPVDEIHVKMPKHRGRREALAVNYAAKKLDQIKPGWDYNIRGWRIDMTSMEYCVLGQIFGSYSRGLRCYTDTSMPFGVPVFIGYGFIASHHIKKAWRREIRARK